MTTTGTGLNEATMPPYSVLGAAGKQQGSLGLAVMVGGVAVVVAGML